MRNGYGGESGRGIWIVDAVTEGRWGTDAGAVPLALISPN